MEIEIGSLWKHKECSAEAEVVQINLDERRCIIVGFRYVKNSSGGGSKTKSNFLDMFEPKSDFNKGFSDKEGIDESAKRQEFNKGFAKGSEHIQGYLKQEQEFRAERERGLQEKAYDEGYLAAVQEMTECDCVEGYSVYEFGAVGDSDDWHNNSEKTKYNLIGIHGLAHSGKDLAGKVLLQELGKEWQRGAFADIPKRMLNVMGVDTGDNYKDGVDGYYDVSFRKMIQTLGTGWGRDMLDKDIWIKAFTKINTPNNYVMTDVRMENEADWVRDNGGMIIHIKGRGGIDSNHESEKGIEIKREDVILFNDKDEESFIQEVVELSKVFKEKIDDSRKRSVR